MTPLVTEAALLVAAAVIGLCTLAVGVVTIVTAAWYHRRDTRRSAVRERLKAGLLERLFESDPGWDEWVETLSKAERRQLEVVLEGYLRELRGTEYDRLCSLADTLGIPAAARENLGVRRRRFRALTWLALLGEDVPVERLRACCTDTPRERAGAARVLYESDGPGGTELLVGEGDQPLSAFGLDTLYRLNDGAETPLLAQFPAAIEQWATPVLVQALFALGYARVDEPSDRLDWLLDLLAHDSPRVRATAVTTIERHGWRAGFRERLDIARLIRDPDPTVRTNSFQLLAAWGDEQSAEQLRACLDGAFDRQLLAVVRALWLHPRAGLPAPTERTRPVVDWVRADGAVTGRQQRLWGGSAAWA